MKRIIKYIKDNVKKDEIFLVGIDGSTGAGKTTFTIKLQEELCKLNYNTVILHIDEFIYNKNIRYNNEYDEWYCFYQLQWRYEYLIKELLDPITRNIDIIKDIEIYDRESDTYNLINFEIKKRTIILLEGVFLQKKEITSFFDYIVFLDLAREERLKRVLKRDSYIGNLKEIKQKYNNRYFPAEDVYF